jgi:hypothetical protein
MAGFDGNDTADDLKTVSINADTSQQQFLTMPHHPVTIIMRPRGK